MRPLFALTTAALITASAVPLHAEDTAKEAAPIPYNTSITIDGDASDWPQNSGIIVRAFAEDGVPTVQTGDFTPTLRLAWNDDGLLVLVNYHSTLPIQTVTPAHIAWQGDSIELFLRIGDRWRNLAQGIITADQQPEPIQPLL